MNPASAATALYTNEASFISAAETILDDANIPLRLENFGSFSIGTDLPITASGIVISSTQTTPGPAQIRSTAESGDSKSIYSNSANSLITFDLSGLVGGGVNAFGFDLRDFGTDSPTAFSMVAGSGQVILHTRIPNALPAGNLLFAGAIDRTNLITTVTVTNTASDDVIYIDNLRFGSVTAIPEPSSASTFFIAGLAWCACSRRCRKKGSPAHA
ncbi:hypothetical protein [Novipirellula aureliae]|nr:hypothetical protein [Novipirellula aureliae]